MNNISFKTISMGRTTFNRILKKVLIILLIGVILMILPGGCSVFAKKYNVSYDSKSAYEDAKDSYRAGTKVRLIYSIIASDTDYTFTVTGSNGELVPLEPSEFGKIIFIMPNQDVRVETTERNSMVKIVE